MPMLKKTLDINSLNEHLFELLSDIQNRIEVTLTQNGVPLAMISPIQTEQTVSPKAALNSGAMTMADTFDEPLPDEFWGI